MCSISYCMYEQFHLSRGCLTPFVLVGSGLRLFSSWIQQLERDKVRVVCEGSRQSILNWIWSDYFDPSLTAIWYCVVVNDSILTSPVNRQWHKRLPREVVFLFMLKCTKLKLESYLSDSYLNVMLHLRWWRSSSSYVLALVYVRCCRSNESGTEILKPRMYRILHVPCVTHLRHSAVCTDHADPAFLPTTTPKAFLQCN